MCTHFFPSLVVQRTLLSCFYCCCRHQPPDPPPPLYRPWVAHSVPGISCAAHQQEGHLIHPCIVVASPRNSRAARRQTTAASGDRKKEEADTKERERERGKRAAMTMKQSRFKRICVFCGSSQGKKASYHDAAVELGNQLVTISRLAPVCHILFAIHASFII